MSLDLSIDEQIAQHLRHIEQEHEVTILFACESGSRAWGFASPDSDYDVRFIYVHRLDWYLRVSPQRDVIEIPINDVLDINGWELRKALALLKKGNATVVEWLNSPIIYQKSSYFERRMRLEAIPQTYQPERSFHHYLHMAKRNYREYLQGDLVKLKKYLYVLRPILSAQWVEQKHIAPPMNFQWLVCQMMPEPTPLRQAIADLLVQKKQALETEYTPKITILNDLIESELARLALINIEVITPDFSILDEILHDMVTRFQDMSQKDTSVIPKGEYCYDVPTPDRTICPYWQKTDYGMIRCNYMGLEDLNEFDIIEAQKLAIAHYGSEEAYRKAKKGGSLLHDEQKICDVNMEWGDEN